LAFQFPLDKLGTINSALLLTGDNKVNVADDGSDEWGTHRWVKLARAPQPRERYTDAALIHSKESDEDTEIIGRIAN
jgi:hypothetical protein